MPRLNLLFAWVCFLLCLSIVLIGLDALAELHLLTKNVSAGLGFVVTIIGSINMFICGIAIDIYQKRINETFGGKNG